MICTLIFLFSQVRDDFTQCGTVPHTVGVTHRLACILYKKSLTVYVWSDF